MHWYTDVIRRYTDFDGRADRPEFWWFALVNLIISVVDRWQPPPPATARGRSNS